MKTCACPDWVFVDFLFGVGGLLTFPCRRVLLMGHGLRQPSVWVKRGIKLEDRSWGGLGLGKIEISSLDGLQRAAKSTWLAVLELLSSPLFLCVKKMQMGMKRPWKSSFSQNFQPSLPPRMMHPSMSKLWLLMALLLVLIVKELLWALVGPLFLSQ